MRLALAVASLLAIVFAATFLGWLTPANYLLRDGRFALDRREARGSIVFVEIDARSLEHVGVWPWPRRVHAEVVDRLLELGAAEIAFDVDFSVPSTPEDDAALEAALERAGGYALLAAFRQLPRPGEVAVTTMPLLRFRQFADPVGVNVMTDNGGVVRRSIGAMEIGGEAIPSLPAALTGVTPPGEFVIDYSIDPAGIERISVADLLDGRVRAGQIADRQVVIGASALELRDVMMAPVHGPLPGALIQILAAETLRQGRPLLPPNPVSGLLLAVAAALVSLVCGRRLPLASGAVITFGAVALIEVAAFLLQRMSGVLLDTAGADLMLVGALVLALALEAFEKRRLQEETARQRQAALERVAHLATYDELSGAFTRSAFTDRIAAAMQRESALTVATIGLDRFERINGALGYAVGDEVLRQVARRIGELRPVTLGRVASDSFAVLFPQSAADEPYFEQIRQALRRPFAANGHEVIVGAHIGVATWRAGPEAVSAVRLLSHAELARGFAARNPNQPLVAHEPAMDARLNEARTLELRLRDALAGERIAVHFQGQYNLATGRLAGAEALARWTTEDLGGVPPSTFVDLAEETGLALPLGAYILDQACALARAWPAGMRLAVNVSPSQFEFDNLVVLIERALQRSGLKPDRLDIEITEGLLLSGGTATIDTLKAIRSLGVGVALDDFGTGYSSLSYLSTLPIDKLKIDQSFVRRLGEDRRVASIVDAILVMCRDLGISSVAEGIETAAQDTWLRERGCDFGQGYFYHRPAPAADFAHLADVSAAALVAVPRRAAS